jgi:hypothetical protein
MRSAKGLIGFTVARWPALEVHRTRIVVDLEGGKGRETLPARVPPRLRLRCFERAMAIERQENRRTLTLIFPVYSES